MVLFVAYSFMKMALHVLRTSLIASIPASTVKRSAIYL